MNRQQVKELLPIIQAFAEGKEIEIKLKSGSKWCTFNENDIHYINVEECDFRIKSEPKYRPFKDKEECWNEMLKHQPFGWVKTDVGYDNLWHTNKGDDFKATFKNCTFADGTPFGIKVKE